MLTYLLQSSTCLIILYGIYHFILSEMTFFKYNRAYLLLSILASLMIPILAPLLVLSEESVPLLHWSHLAGDITYIVADNEVDVFDWKGLMGNVLWAIYFVGVVVVLLKMMFGLSKIFRYYRQGQKGDFNGYRIITTEAVHLPFSFFNSIYISRHVPLQDHVHTILEHEEIHIRQWHTLDVLMAEMVHAFFWFNPVMIFYKRALRQAHEYLADDLICRKNSVSSYTELLLSKSQSGLELALTNQFFHSQIKKRIQMMTTHKTNRSAAWKYALVLPLLMGLVVLFSSSSIKQKTEDFVANDIDSIPAPQIHLKNEHSQKVKNINIHNKKATVQLENGKTEKYDLDKTEEKEAFHAKYGDLPAPPPPPPAPTPATKMAPPSPPSAPSPPNYRKGNLTPPDAPAPPPAPPALTKEFDNQNEDKAVIQKIIDKDEAQAEQKDSNIDILDALFKKETLEKPLFLIDGIETNISFIKNKKFTAQSIIVYQPKTAIERYGEKAKYGSVELIKPTFTTNN
jgi:BlaR1 peptidase M56